MAAAVLKRKRSIDGLGPSDSSSTLTTMDVSPHSLYDVPANLNSRTFKRFRDTRPSDEEVHQRTLGLLYSAQQRPQQEQEQMQHTPEQQQQQAEASNNQQSLHKFWNINSAPSSTSSLQQPVLTPAECEDCGAGLGGGCSGGDGMDVDGLEDTACGACGKHVCFSCSVSNLGEQKRCLQCAGRRVWIGGIGWTTTSVPVC
ncbi:hypothetical protein PT974_05939 [Cladobotryum mycophilum]|uniref:Uncharacterized protein n=1 Tax=Cladobotryum mycophilum TaxID=491253 RepID=A0ABR0SK53_9HYPO